MSSKPRTTLLVLGSVATVGALAAVTAVVLARRKRQSSSVSSSSLLQFEKLATLQVLNEVTQDALLARDAAGVVRVVHVIDAGTKLGHVPPALCHFTLLSSLDLSGNAIVYLPHSIAALRQLVSLNVSRNQLAALPPEIGELTALTSLDCSRNRLAKAPAQLCLLTGLKALNLMCNQLASLPESIGALTGVRILGLKSNVITHLPTSFTRLTGLVELFITDNRLATLPEGFGALTSLVKLQASFNPFTSLPEDLFDLPRLEMFRLAVGSLPAWPRGLAEAGKLPALAWCSLGGNPAAVDVPLPPEGLPRVTLEGLQLGGALGDGASGEVKTGQHAGEQVAVKLFRADVSPDGRTYEEVGISCSVAHPHITRVRAMVSEPQALVFDLVKGRPLAAKPTSAHLLRCKWNQGDSFSEERALRICSGVASALSHLHAMGVCHGDVYAHNILVDDDHHAVLCDFGAAYCYDPSDRFWEAIEVRAYGIFAHDLAERLQPDGTRPEVAERLRRLVTACKDEAPAARPTFAEIVEQLRAMSKPDAASPASE